MTMAEELAAGDKTDPAVMLGGGRSETLARASAIRRMGLRAAGEQSAHIVLYEVAESEAQSVMERLCFVADKGQVAGILYGHLTKKDLASVIFRHAMIHAGLVGPKVPKGGGEFHPYETCPICGKNL